MKKEATNKRMTHEEAIREEAIYPFSIPYRVETAESFEYRTAHIWARLVRGPWMKKKLFRIYKDKIDDLDGAALFFAPNNCYGVIYEVPLEQCEKKKLYGSENGSYYIFAAEEMKAHNVYGKTIGKALYKIVEEEKIKKRTKTNT
jgi:hypothetical protein